MLCLVETMTLFRHEYVTYHMLTKPMTRQQTSILHVLITTLIGIIMEMEFTVS